METTDWTNCFLLLVHLDCRRIPLGTTWRSSKSTRAFFEDSGTLRGPSSFVSRIEPLLKSRVEGDNVTASILDMLDNKQLIHGSDFRVYRRRWPCVFFCVFLVFAALLSLSELISNLLFGSFGVCWSSLLL